jgi:type I restriction enzyme M protein
MSLSASIKSIQDIMRKDVGVDGDAQRISQLVWLLFLKIFDAAEEELERTPTTTARRCPKNSAGATGLSDPEGNCCAPPSRMPTIT